jgi:hypothetical protein
MRWSGTAASAIDLSRAARDLDNIIVAIGRLFYRPVRDDIAVRSDRRAVGGKLSADREITPGTTSCPPSCVK